MLGETKSPSPITRRLKIENEKLEDEWRGCCSKSDRSFIKYITQILMGSTVMLFCMVQIFRGSNNLEIYFSMLSGTLGLFLPHPQMIKEK
jgi:hypothetical protein